MIRLADFLLWWFKWLYLLFVSRQERSSQEMSRQGRSRQESAKAREESEIRDHISGLEVIYVSSVLVLKISLLAQTTDDLIGRIASHWRRLVSSGDASAGIQSMLSLPNRHRRGQKVPARALPRDLYHPGSGTILAAPPGLRWLRSCLRRSNLPFYRRPRPNVPGC